MFKQLMTLSLTAAALAIPAPAAHAGHATFECGMVAVAEETITGGRDTYAGVASGYIASPTPGEALSIRCTVEVDGTEVASTPTGSGTQAATTSGLVSFTASETQDVKVCTGWTAGWDSGKTCFGTWSSPIPPQEVRDFVDDATWIVHAVLCPVLGALESSIVGGTVVIDETGDVSVLGSTIIDCWPYNTAGPQYPGATVITNIR